MFRSLIRRFAESAERYPDHAALVVDNRRLSYTELLHEAISVAQTMSKYQEHDTPLVAVFGSRTVSVYAAILAALASGKGYVPLNPKFPSERTRDMLQASEATVAVVDRKGAERLGEVLAGITRPLTILLPDLSDASGLASRFPQHRFVPAGRFECGNSHVTEAGPDSVAYLLFTSGSTGRPKGVAIRQSNVQSYVDYTVSRYEVNDRDRLSQEFDLTFDLSVHDMFVGWERGACLYCVPENQIGFPAKFIRDNALTMWFSVPSVVGTLSRVRLLQAGAFPSLRWSLFCGEPLSANYAALWQQTAPNSVVENLYGPTETTIAISNYRWNSASSPEECLNGIVPIGWMFSGQGCRVVDSNGHSVATDEIGQLCLGGSQVASGYWNNPDKTRQQFIPLPGEEPNRVWYSTGDLVKQDARQCLFYLGRVDHQVKIRGYRVELQEVDLVLRRACGTDQVVTVPWPVKEGTAEGLIAFVCAGENGHDSDRARIIDACRQFLPDYMVPNTVCFVPEIPLNENGKTDKRKLISQLEGGRS